MRKLTWKEKENETDVNETHLEQEDQIWKEMIHEAKYNNKSEKDAEEYNDLLTSVICSDCLFSEDMCWLNDQSP